MTRIKNLITNYQATQCETSFEEIYADFNEQLINTARKKARDYKLAWEDVESETYFVLLKAVRSFDIEIGDFEKYLFSMLKRHLINMVKLKARYLNYTDRYLEDAPTSTGNEPEIAAIKKEQRQLLEEITANADPKSRQALVAFASTTSFREAAKLIGVEHKTVKNRIEKLSAARQHISLNEYITA